MDVTTASATVVQLSDLETLLLKFLFAVLTILAGFAVTKLQTWIGVQNDAGTKAAFDKVLDDTLQFGFDRATAMIKDKGWDHVDVKNNVVSVAASYAIAKFPDALKAVGVSSDPSVAAQQLTSALLRKYAGAATIAASSPATPPAPPPAPVAVVDASKT